MENSIYVTSKLPLSTGGFHDTLVVNDYGLVDCHSTVNYGGNRTLYRDTHFGQSRLTDFFSPTTGQIYR